MFAFDQFDVSTKKGLKRMMEEACKDFVVGSNSTKTKKTRRLISFVSEILMSTNKILIYKLETFLIVRILQEKLRRLNFKFMFQTFFMA